MIGNRIKQLREEKGLSQAELANAIQIAQSSIGNYERELRAPDSETILALAKYFNVTSDYLLGLADDPQKQPSATEELGLSYDAVERLIAWNTRYPNGNEALSTLSRLITYSEFFHVLYSISLLLENASNEFNASGSSSEDIEALSQKAAEMGFSVVKKCRASQKARQKRGRRRPFFFVRTFHAEAVFVSGWEHYSIEAGIGKGVMPFSCPPC